MLIREKIYFPFQGRTTGTIEIAGRLLRVRIDRKFDDYAVALEITAKPDRTFVRVPLDLVRAFDDMFPSNRFSTVTRSICVHWEGLKDPAFMFTSSLAPWPTAASSRQASWARRNTADPTWVGYEPAMRGETGSGHIVFHAPRSKGQISTSDANPGPHDVWLRLWSTYDRPHLWPRYELFGGAAGQLILYTIGGLAHGRFKLAKRQLDEFLTLRCRGSLWLGFYDEAQGIDVTCRAEGVRLAPPKNADKAEPYYVIEAAAASRHAEQLSLAL